MTTDELIARFEDATLPGAAFDHAHHVEAAWGYLRRFTLPEALARFTAALQRFAAANGATTKYHATITTAYMLLIAERMTETGAEEWTEFAARHPDLLAWKPSVLARYYRPETCASERARTTFVMPDRLAD